MSVFVDTSALLAVLNAADVAHRRADEMWAQLLAGDRPLRTHSYVVVETSALVQRRHGMDALRSLHDEILPVLSVRCPDIELHRRATTALVAAGRRDISLVDWTSFEVMREEGLVDAFAFDEDFDEHGFRTLPRPS
ncbi:MAG: PIN domain-containing protein [Actinomycetota bacterium]